MDATEATVSSPIEGLSEGDVFSSENFMSSPLSSKTTGAAGTGKPRRPPPITPNSFRRFFTPRSAQVTGTKIGASRKALQDITNPARNSDGSSPQRLFPGPELFRDIPRDTSTDSGFEFTTPTSQRKRGFLISPESTPEHYSPSKKLRNLPPIILEDEEEEVIDEAKLSAPPLEMEQAHDLMAKPPLPTPIRRRLPNINGRIYQRSLGCWGTGRPFGRLQISCNWQYETAAFYSPPEDRYEFKETDGDGSPLPFCTASCNKSTLVAIGDEEGQVRILETNPDEKPDFSAAFLQFQAHDNAILDLAFSSDDLWLATGSGDQTARIIDMTTQRPIYSLPGHSASVKQVRFQPGGTNNVIATSSRDGAVHIWDLRCKGGSSSVHQVHVPLDPDSIGAAPNCQPPRRISRGRPINSIFEAHANRSPAVPLGSSTASSALAEGLLKSEPTERRGDVSVTALSFLNPGREHLLLTASEANATVKLWDLRTTYTHRRGRTIPVSTTRQPEAHNTHRHFGINSLTLNGDGSRLFTLCRDNTVYAYSTSHLVLGHSPELSAPNVRSRRAGGVGKDGLGPLYGLRHPQLHATTFYVKAALREASGDKSELLAVGSSDGCAVLFPTDERYLTRSEHLSGESGPFFSMPMSNTPTPPATPRTSTRSPGVSGARGLASRLNDTIPIYRHGSALVHGHSREVTSLTWTPRGELVTIGDDMAARCWREGPKARELRRGDEGDGRLWDYGWAEAEPGFDEDDDE